MNRPSSALLLVALTGLLASFLVLFGAPPDADACSIAPPQLEVSPRTELRPGDSLKVRGTGFNDAIWNDVARVETAASRDVPSRSVTAIAPSVVPNSCTGLELVPQVVVLSWIGSHEQPLQRVIGPDFELELRVPEWARPGWAAVSANGVLAEVKVGDGRPEPCPVAGVGIDADHRPDHCPKPCPDFDHVSGRVAHPPCPDPCDALVRPATTAADSSIWCPDPCPVHAQGDAGVEVLPPHCPDPCSTDAVNTAIWCPPPCPDLRDLDPAQVTEEEWKRRVPHCPWPCDAVAAGDAALSWWPCPRPCPRTPLLDDDVDAEEWRNNWRHCPWPCPLLLDAVEADLAVWPCPEPCPVYVHGGGLDGARPADAEGLSVWCPNPCGWPGLEDGTHPPADAAWSHRCPDPCRGVPVDSATGVGSDEVPPGEAAIWCPYPLTVPAPEPIPCPVDPGGTTRCEGGAVGLMTATTIVSPDPSISAVAAGGGEFTSSGSPVRPVASGAGPARAPRIDFDGCRADGPSPCLDVVYDQAVQTLRRMVGVLAGR